MSEQLSKIQQESNKVYESVEEWRAEAVRRFGEDPMAWRFVCPSCKHPQSLQDYKDAGAPSTVAGFSCVGRYLSIEKSTDAFSGKPGPCSYAGGGLFRLNPVTINGPDGPQAVFDFAETPSVPYEKKETM